MEKMGTVLEERGDRALVLLRRHMACEGCGKCGGILGGPDQQDEEIEVLNLIGASQGELVRVKIDDQKVLLLSFIIYMVPVLALVFGLLGGFWLASAYNLVYDPNLVGVGSGLLFMLVVFLIIKKWDASVRYNQKYQPEIISWAEEEKEG